MENNQGNKKKIAFFLNSSFWLMFIICMATIILTFSTMHRDRKIIQDYQNASDALLAKYQEVEKQSWESAVDFLVIKDKTYIIINKDRLLTNHKDEKIVSLKYTLTINEKEQYILPPISDGRNHMMFQVPDVRIGGNYSIRVVTTKSEFNPGS